MWVGCMFVALTAILLVAVVAAVVFVIAPGRGLDAALSRVAPELVESARRPHRRWAALLVLSVSAVEITVASLLLGYTVLGTRAAALEVVGLTFSVD